MKNNEKLPTPQKVDYAEQRKELQKTMFSPEKILCKACGGLTTYLPLPRCNCPLEIFENPK